MIAIETSRIEYKNRSTAVQTEIADVAGIVFRPGVTLESGASAGTWTRGLHACGGWVFVWSHVPALALLGITAAIDLLVYHQAQGADKTLTLADVVFGGNTVGAEVLTQELGTPSALFSREPRRGRDTRLIGVPWMLNLASGSTLATNVTEA